ncbi:MAG: cadmium-translocating P-type ATPase [Treponema sp.]|jgi:Cd2+/Zn2+-exporting ATPase|nr:cadmium-translocating P-type ATPase [Treponema sp.]
MMMKDGEYDDDCCDCCHDERDRDEAATGRLIRFGLYALPVKRLAVFAGALVLWAAGIVLLKWGPPSGILRYIPLAPFLAAYALAGFPVLRKALQGILRGKALDENFLMAIATIGAFAVGEWEEAVGVMIFYMIGELVQDAAVEKSRRSIKALLSLKPDTARVREGNTWAEVAADTVTPGTLILVRPGERVPLDGIVVEGEGAIDESALTGESRPLVCKSGDEVHSGTVSLEGVLTIRSTKTADNSTVARIISLVESAREAKAKPERFITAFARRYTPAVVAGALLLALIPPLLIPGASFADWVYRALILLVISCPCALVVSIPLGYFAGIGGLSRRGVMVKGAASLDTLRKARFVAFDKTGTLTQGTFEVTALEPAPGTDPRQLLETAALAEAESNHPIATAIRRHAAEQGAVPGATAPSATAPSATAPSATAPGAIGRREIAGMGLEVRLPGDFCILAGSGRFLESQGVHIPPSLSFASHAADSAVYVAQDGRYLGRVLIGDTDREGAAEAVRRIKELGVEETLMLSGDAQGPVRAAARRLGISTVKAELLPGDKLAEVEALTSRGTTVFVGDGINDAPVLARADVGIAMGSGADVAVEAADIIIMTGDPRRVPEAIEGARRIRRIVIGNTVLALVAKAIFIVLAVLGLANMWLALFADVGVALLAILNSARALGKR